MLSTWSLGGGGGDWFVTGEIQLWKLGVGDNSKQIKIQQKTFKKKKRKKKNTYIASRGGFLNIT